jgi:hypothetical protein
MVTMISFYRMVWDGERKRNGDTHGMVDWLVYPPGEYQKTIS